MINQDHQPYVDADGWLLPGDAMLSINDKVYVSEEIKDDPGITKEYAELLSGKLGMLMQEKIISYHCLTGSSCLIKFNEPLPSPDGSQTVVEEFWVPRRYVYQYEEKNNV